MKAVELEAKRTTSEALHSPSFLISRESKREAKREWREAHEKELKERRLRGITEKNAYKIDSKLKFRHLLETSEMAQKRSESKKEKERNRVLNYGWNIFGQVLLQERIHHRMLSIVAMKRGSKHCKPRPNRLQKRKKTTTVFSIMAAIRTFPKKRSNVWWRDRRNRTRSTANSASGAPCW